jgi:1-acyl-sn-glycerol-3-phosphate acyltransferase
MLPARPSFLHRNLFRLWLPSEMRRKLHGVYLLEGSLTQLPPNTPVLLTPNHSSWWDGFIALWLAEQYFGRTFRVLMREDQLRRYAFFRGLGAFGIRQESPASVRAALKYMNELLLDPKMLLVVFPQGKIRPQMVQEWELRSGLTRLSAANAVVVPAYFHQESLNNPRPTQFIRLGQPQPLADIRQQPPLLTEALENLRLETRHALEHQQYGTRLFGRAIEPIV